MNASRSAAWIVSGVLAFAGATARAESVVAASQKAIVDAIASPGRSQADRKPRE